ncbi:MAG: hypothetical protein MUD02_08895 [Bacteroidales bacterium]|nr:hypothetical protein [Bacteroidales bacterium]
MTGRYIITAAISIIAMMPLSAQEKGQEGALNREITLFNPYKPTLNSAKKRSFLPDMKDTVRIKPQFSYEVSSEPFLPAYTVSPIKAASLLPDPLPKLYKSYVNLGMGNYVSPLAEISITNERSKKGSLGFYGRHFSSNSNIDLANSKEMYAGMMDNEASLSGRRFFRRSVFESSADFTQIVRHAYGYNPSSALAYDPGKEDIRMRYNNIGAKAAFRSATIDSLGFAYDFSAWYNYFYHLTNMAQHNYGIEGIMAKPFKGFYVGSGMDLEFYKNSDSLSTSTDFIFSLSPFIRKSTSIWNFKIGLQALVDRRSSFHLYPDVNFGFSIVPSYASFYASMTGKLERNEPLKIVRENPYLANSQYPGLMPDGILFTLPDTDHELVLTAGIKGNTGLEGKYLASVSYSMISDMLFYTNLYNSDPLNPAMGNYFSVDAADVDLLNIHGEMSGRFSDKITYAWNANYYNYSTTGAIASYKPDWDARFELRYDLRSKIIAGAAFTATGSRTGMINADYASGIAGYPQSPFELPAHFNLNLSAEYRYSKILSFWTRLNNIALKGYEEWVFYPTHRFQFMLGFTYSL